MELTKLAAKLAQSHIDEKVVGPARLVDAQNIAIATVNHVTAIVSWNFKHIVNLNRIRGYNAANLKMGYGMVEIRTPWEVLKYED